MSVCLERVLMECLACHCVLRTHADTWQIQLSGLARQRWAAASTHVRTFSCHCAGMSLSTAQAGIHSESRGEGYAGAQAVLRILRNPDATGSELDGVGEEASRKSAERRERA